MNLHKKERILELLLDGKVHFSSEFRDQLGFLEYRKPISELRRNGHNITPIRVANRPAYKLEGICQTSLF